MTRSKVKQENETIAWKNNKPVRDVKSWMREKLKQMKTCNIVANYVN